MGRQGMKGCDIHADSLATSTALSSSYVPEMIPPLEVIRVLNGGGVRFVLVGAHALGGWMREPRTALFVDVLVSSRSCRKAVQTLLLEFSHFEAEQNEAVTRLKIRHTYEAGIDVHEANRPFLRESLKHVLSVRAKGHRYDIPTVEMALAMTYEAMIRLPWSDADKFLHAHDFLCILKANPDLDMTKVADFGEIIHPGKWFLVKTVQQVRVDGGASLQDLVP